MAAFFPTSAATLIGQRRVMCEMSDFDQTFSGKDPADLPHMQAATAWQMAFGVTDFNLYYTITYGDKYPDRKEAAYRKYCNFVGRVNSILMEAKPIRKTLLYYPIYDFQREYIPTAEEMSLNTQSGLTSTLSVSFCNLGSNLLKAQNQFVLVDYLTLEKATVNSDGTIQIGNIQYSSIVFPKGVVFPPSVLNLVGQAKAKGVKMVFANDFNECPSPEQLSKLAGVENRLIPANTSIAFGEFMQMGRAVFLMVNTGNDPYTGQLKILKGRRYQVMDPQTGEVSTEKNLEGHAIALNLEPLQSKLFIVL